MMERFDNYKITHQQLEQSIGEHQADFRPLKQLMNSLENESKIHRLEVNYGKTK